MDWIRKISALFLLLAFGFQCFNKAFVVVNYYTNINAYAEKCINKSRPKMHCNGKCQMMKKLKQEDKKDAENPERKSENKSEISSPFLIVENTYCIIGFTFQMNYPTYNNNALYKMPRSCFRPPGLV